MEINDRLLPDLFAFPLCLLDFHTGRHDSSVTLGIPYKKIHPPKNSAQRTKETS